MGEKNQKITCNQSKLVVRLHIVKQKIKIDTKSALFLTHSKFA